jgi:hypothetical protein
LCTAADTETQQLLEPGETASNFLFLQISGLQTTEAVALLEERKKGKTFINCFEAKDVG